MEDPKAAARRFLVGLIAVVLLTAAVLLWILPGTAASDGTAMWRGACGRIGIVMVALWMALPSGTRPAAWANVNIRSVAAVALAALALRFPLRLLLPVAIVLVIMGAFVRPRGRVRPPQSNEIESR